jgi:tripartite-type tricarboxylate transporter receptor subunit TctC
LLKPQNFTPTRTQIHQILEAVLMMFRSIKPTIGRRNFVKIGALAGAGLLPGINRRAIASTFPDQPINFIIPYGPGGSFDSFGREFSKLLTEDLKVNVEPINQPGGGGAEAIFELNLDDPDGYNISLINVPGVLFTNSQHGIDVNKLTWLANIGRDPYGLAVGINSNVKTVADLQALSAKRAINFSSTGKGATDYLAIKIFASVMGLRVNLITGYQSSSDAAVAATRGDVDAVVYSWSVLEEAQKAGLIRMIFIFERESSFPGIEGAIELGKPELGDIYQWRPVVAPPNLPPVLASTLSEALLRVAKSPEAVKWAVELQTTLYLLDQQQTLAMVKEQQKIVEKYQSIL